MEAMGVMLGTSKLTWALLSPSSNYGADHNYKRPPGGYRTLPDYGILKGFSEVYDPTFVLHKQKAIKFTRATATKRATLQTISHSC